MRMELETTACDDDGRAAVTGTGGDGGYDEDEDDEDDDDDYNDDCDCFGEVDKDRRTPSRVSRDVSLASC